MRSDNFLVERCLAGERQAWEQLVTRYERLIYKIARHSGLSMDDAADVFQNVCLALYRNLHKLRNEQHVTGWLILTTKREVWRLHRQQRNHDPLPTTEAEEQSLALQSDTLPPEHVMLQLEQEQMVRAAMEELGESCRTLLQLRYHSDPPPSYADIARHLNVAEGAIGPMRARCLQKLRKLLEKEGF